jgi:F0F1-type ATP synthase assembly protein I
LFGSLAVFLPAVLFATLVGSRIGQDSTVFLRAAVLGEAGKLFLTAVLCAVVFIWVKPLAAGWFFTGMMSVLAAGWLGLIFNK